MNRRCNGLAQRLGLLTAMVMSGNVPVWGDAPSAQQSAVCQDRAPCRIVATFDAGQAEDGTKLTVLHVALALDDANPPVEPDASQPNCRPYPEEYWLAQAGQEGKIDYRRLFAFCNDGYGASGIGEDAVTVGPNRITHRRAGGSTSRWEQESIYQLLPERPLSFINRGYSTVQSGCLEVETGFAPLVQRGWFNAPSAEEEGVGNCDRATAQNRFLAIPRLAENGAESAATLEKQAAGLGSCALTLKATGEPDAGFVIHGNPDRQAQVEIKLLALTESILLAQIRDQGRTLTVSKNWINDDRLELWLGAPLDTGPSSADLNRPLYQFGVRLADGTAFVGYGTVERLPTVRRWMQGNARLVQIDWTDTGIEAGSVTLVYGQGDGRKQGRMIATSALKYADPHTLGQWWAFPADCELRDGLLNAGALRPGTAAMQDQNTAQGRGEQLPRIGN